MSKKVKALVAGVICFLIVMTPFAWILCDQYLMQKGFKLELSEDGKYYSVCGYWGQNKKKAVIPRRYKGKPVTKIIELSATHATDDLPIDTLVIHDGIEYIGFDVRSAYDYANIVYEGTIEDWCKIEFPYDGYLYYFNVQNNFYFGDQLVDENHDIYIPNSVTKINEGAFVGMKADTFYIGENVTEIGDRFCVDVKNFSVDENNQWFKTYDEGVLYSKDRKELIAYPSGRQAETRFNATVGGWTKYYGIYGGTNIIRRDAFYYSSLDEIVFDYYEGWYGIDIRNGHEIELSKSELLDSVEMAEMLKLGRYELYRK